MRDDARFASRVERLYKESGQVGARRTDDGGWGTDGLAWPADHAGCDLEELHVRDWGGRPAAALHTVWRHRGRQRQRGRPSSPDDGTHASQ